MISRDAGGDQGQESLNVGPVRGQVYPTKSALVSASPGVTVANKIAAPPPMPSAS